MNFDFGNASITTNMYGASPNTTPGSNSVSIDMAKSEWAIVVCGAGVTWSPDVTFTLQDSADDSTFAAVDGVGAITLSAAGAVTSFLIDASKVRRYIRVNSTKAGAGNSVVSVTGFQYWKVHSSDATSYTEVI